MIINSFVMAISFIVLKTESLLKKKLHFLTLGFGERQIVQINCIRDHSPRARHPGM